MPDDDGIKTKSKGSSQGFDISQLPSWFFYALLGVAILNVCFSVVLLVLVALVYTKP